LPPPPTRSPRPADLAAALRWAARLGLGEGICNHDSLALAGSGDRYLINPFGVHWAEMRASRLPMLDNEDLRYRD
jgi:ribulose-5-phosphate 4-epimerase/fuculose-1-phosphate aldolase